MFALIGVGIAAIGLCIEFPCAAREAEFWLSAVLGMVLPMLAISSWGLVFRRFAFGSAWIAGTILVSSLVCGGFAAIVAFDARGKDSIGHGLILLFGTPLLFLALIVVSSVPDGVYWKRRFRRASHESYKTSPGNSHP